MDADRMDLDPYRVEHQSRRDTGEDPSLTECLRLQESYPCPLLAHPWAARDVTGGITVTVAATPNQVARLHDFIRCYHAHGRHDKHDQTCLGRLAPVHVSGGHYKGKMTMTLLAGRPALAVTLRKRVRALIAEAR